MNNQEIKTPLNPDQAPNELRNGDVSEWKEIILKDIISVSSGEGLPESKMKPGQFPVYGGNGIAGYHNNFVFEENKLIIGRVGAHCGNIHITHRNSWITDNALIVSFLNSKQDIYFWYYTLSELRIRKYAFESAQPVITGGTLGKIKVVVPSLSAQQKIAKILSTADAVIEKTQVAIAKYKAIKQGLLHDLFTRGVVPQTVKVTNEQGVAEEKTVWKLRPTYQDAPHLYKESKLGMVPIEWEVNELMYYLNFISYGFTNPMPESGEGPFLITAANVNGGKIQYDSCRKTSKEAFDTLLTDKSRPKINDILLTKDGTLGRIALVDKEFLCINQSVAVLRPNLLINPLFLKILLESPSYQKTMLDEAGGSTIKHIYITIVDKMPIAVPKTIHEQKEIAFRLNTITQKLQTEQAYLQKLYRLKAGLMGDLLSGRKNVLTAD